MQHASPTTHPTPIGNVVPVLCGRGRGFRYTTVKVTNIYCVGTAKLGIMQKIVASLLMLLFCSTGLVKLTPKINSQAHDEQVSRTVLLGALSLSTEWAFGRGKRVFLKYLHQFSSFAALSVFETPFASTVYKTLRTRMHLVKIRERILCFARAWLSSFHKSYSRGQIDMLSYMWLVPFRLNQSTNFQLACGSHGWWFAMLVRCCVYSTKDTRGFHVTITV